MRPNYCEAKGVIAQLPAQHTKSGDDDKKCYALRLICTRSRKCDALLQQLINDKNRPIKTVTVIQSCSGFGVLQGAEFLLQENGVRDFIVLAMEAACEWH